MELDLKLTFQELFKEAVVKGFLKEFKKLSVGFFFITAAGYRSTL